LAKIKRNDGVDGLSQSTVNAYKREHPGSKLQTAVTEKKPKVKEQNVALHSVVVCSGMKSKLTSAKTARDPDIKELIKALRRWNLQRK
jgi:glutamate 5-kinase